MSEIPPEIMKDFGIVGAYHLENGLTDFASWSAKMIQEFGPRITPYLDQIFKDSTSVFAHSAHRTKRKEHTRLFFRKSKKNEKLEDKKCTVEGINMDNFETKKIGVDTRSFIIGLILGAILSGFLLTGISNKGRYEFHMPFVFDTRTGTVKQISEYNPKNTHQLGVPFEDMKPRKE